MLGLCTYVFLSTICLSSLLAGKVFGTKANYVIAECEYQEGEGEEEDEPDTQVSPCRCLSPSTAAAPVVGWVCHCLIRFVFISFLPFQSRRRKRSHHKRKAKRMKVGSLLCGLECICVCVCKVVDAHCYVCTYVV